MHPQLQVSRLGGSSPLSACSGGKDLREGPGRASMDRPPAQRVSPRSGRGARLRRDVVTNPGGKKRHTSLPSVTLGQSLSSQLASGLGHGPYSLLPCLQGSHGLRTSHSANSGVGSVEGLGACTSSSLSLCDPGTATHQGALVPGQLWVPRLLSPSFWEPSFFSLPPSLPLRPWT